MHPPLEAAHPLAPRYWRHETSGQLERYLNTVEPLTVRDVALIRAYFVQWIDSPVWDMNPAASEKSRRALALLRSDARRIANWFCITAWVLRAMEEGMDPL
jgi:hypothetical protein